ncbi:MAG: acetyltransferase [Chitinophagaceae bacterium]|nr:acetyltransferase [Chitinophagaceae bacterium]
MKEKLILIGGGGHCKSCIEVIESTGKYDIVGILDTPEKVGEMILDYKIIGTDADIIKFIEKGITNYFVTVGQIKTATLKKKLFENIEHHEGVSPVIISSSAIVSKRTNINVGTIIMHGAKVNADAVVGKNCIINTMANIEHDVIIGDHVHISTGAVVNGEVKIGDEVMVGSSVVIRNGVSICDNVVIGAGSVVVKDITEQGMYIGNPLKNIQK